MDTDEYQISLSREIAVCNAKLRALRMELETMERLHGMPTEVFIGRLDCGEIRSDDAANRIWFERYQVLKDWQERLTEFEGLYRNAKK